MATRTTVSLLDDLDGTTAEESVAFGLDGATYEIDLSETNAVRLRDAVAIYIASARRTGGRRAATLRPPSTSASSGSASTGAVKRSSAENQAIRTWAAEHGAFVPARGRIPGLLVNAYEANDPSMLPAAASAGPESAGPESAGPESAAAARAPEDDPAPEPTAGDEARTAQTGAADEPRGRDGLTASERDIIRAWAVEEGIEVKARGQLKKDLIANYRAVSKRR